MLSDGFVWFRIAKITPQGVDNMSRQFERSIKFVYHSGNRLEKITVENDIGIAIILPIRIDEPDEDTVAIIEV